MSRFHVTFAALVAVSSTVVCGQAARDVALSGDLSAASSEQLRAAYLECDRMTSRQSVGPEYMSACAEIGSVLLHRDFGGDFQRQIDWWKHARAAGRSEQEALAPPGMRR